MGSKRLAKKAKLQTAALKLSGNKKSKLDVKEIDKIFDIVCGSKSSRDSEVYTCCHASAK